MLKKLSKNKKLLLAVVLLLIFAGGAVFLNFAVSVKNKTAFLQNNSWARQILHSWRSVKKLSDVLFCYYWFQPKNMPVFNIYDLSGKDIVEMNNALPEDIINGHLDEENKIKESVKFSFGDYYNKVQIRYSGADSNHWDSFKKSYMIQFPKTNLFEGMKSFHLKVPNDRLYYIEPLNNYRAKKFGLVTPQFSFVNLKINGYDYGIYEMVEHWTQEWLEKQRYIADNNIFVLDDELLAKEPLFGGQTSFSLSSVKFWKSYTNETQTDFPELEALFSVLSEKNEEVFKKEIGNILDLEKFYHWDVINILADSVHQSDYSNLILLFNKATGKFELIPWDVGIGYTNKGADEPFAYKPETLIAKRILAIDEFKQKRDQILNDYVSDPKNLEDDLNHYDTLFKETKGDFLSDTVKFYSNFSYLSSIKHLRQYVIDDFNSAKERAGSIDYEYAGDKEGEKNFTGSFSFFEESYKDIGAFLRENYQFYWVDGNTVGLSAGPHIFRKTVVVPKGLKLVVDPGAHLYFDKDVSFVVYGSVFAQGNQYLPIKFLPMGINSKWGVFGVLNAEEKSVFKYVTFSGGSEALINGVVFTSQLSLNHSDALIENSVFENAKSDDGLHIINGKAEISDCIFRNNFADDIDLDFASGWVKNSDFTDHGADSNGDCVDLSGSRVEVSNNHIASCGDKGISVGEESFPLVKQNLISSSNIGIAVKDKSEAVLENNIIKGNEIGIALYRKKQIFGGAVAWSFFDVIEENKTRLTVDEFSKFYEKTAP